MKNWILWLVVGVLSVLGGVLALANPLAASVAAETIIAWTFLLAGVLQVITAIRARGFAATLWAALIGVLGVLIGVSLLANPLAGLVSLTTIMGVVLLALGLAKLITAWSLRGADLFWLILLSGALSILLGAMIFASFPASVVRSLGLLLAIELISNGVALIALSLMRRRAGV